MVTNGSTANPASAPAFARAFRAVRSTWWVRTGRMYLLSRLYSSLLIGGALLVALALGWHVPSYSESPAWLFADPIGQPTQPDFFTFSGLWDGEYYRYIAAHGYPVVLPHNPDGSVASNPWAFLPAYAYLVAGLSLGNPAAFFVVGTVVSMLFGAAATILLQAVVREASGETAGRFAALVFAFGPLSYLLQVTYAESMFLCFVFAAILLLQRRRYWLMTGALVVAAFTRPGEVSFALALGIVFLLRLRTARRAGDRGSFPIRERVALGCAALVALVAGLAWVAIAAFVTGDPTAYFESELSWRIPYLGDASFVPFTPWFAFAGRYVGIAGILIVVLLLVGAIWWLTRRTTRRLGAPILASVGSYMLYLFAVLLPQQSAFRLLMPAAPLLGDAWLVPRPRLRAAILAVGIALQPLCVWLLWCVGNP